MAGNGIANGKIAAKTLMHFIAHEMESLELSCLSQFGWHGMPS